MRFHLLASFSVSLLLAGCAFEGVVVEKRSRPRPDSSMIGTEGVQSFVFRGPTGTSRPPITVPSPQFWTETNGRYTFVLRDRQGNVRSQMVTAAVFARYRVGDYFNDLLPPTDTPDTKEARDRTVKPVACHLRSVKHQHRIAQAGRIHGKVAGHHHRKRQKAVAGHAANAAPQS